MATADKEQKKPLASIEAIDSHLKDMKEEAKRLREQRNKLRDEEKKKLHGDKPDPNELCEVVAVSHSNQKDVYIGKKGTAHLIGRTHLWLELVGDRPRRFAIVDVKRLGKAPEQPQKKSA